MHNMTNILPYHILQYCMLLWFFLLSADFFSKLTFSKNSLMNTIRVSDSLYLTREFFNCLPASGHLYHLLLSLANSLDPDQDRQTVGPDLDPNCLTL